MTAVTERPLRVAFVMEQHLGHRSFYENLRCHVEADPTVHAWWTPVGYGASDSWWERLPGVPAGARGALRGRHEARRGLRESVDVAFFNTQVPAVLAGRAARRVPFVLCTDVTPVQYDRMAQGYGHVPDGTGLVAALKHAANQRVFQVAALTIGWSSWVRESLVEDYGVKPARALVIPPGVDTQRWRPAPRSPTGARRILFVGGDFDRKGGKTLVDAFRLLPPGVAELTLVTRTPVAAEPGVTVRHGLGPNSAELVELYRTSDVFVLASEAEAFGIAAVEAAASGLPVIATPVGGLPDIVVHDETGFLVAPGDTEGLACRLRQLLDDRHLARRLGTAGRRRAVERFDAATNAERLIQSLRDAAAMASRGRPVGRTTVLAVRRPDPGSSRR
jgi:glycosyltransferase involved in cell wall biosynthesis